MISVIIPCYNAAATLAETVESALVQPVECEVIIVNDGSTDGSQQIIEAFGARVRSLTTVNRGVSAARSSGLALAKGDFINYLDSDDVLTPGTLRARLDAIAREGADVVHTDWRKLVQRGDGRFALGDIKRPDVGAIAADAERETARGSFWAPPAALLYTRAIVVRIGAWHPKLPVIQDARYLFDAAAQGARFAYVAGSRGLLPREVGEPVVQPRPLPRRLSHQHYRDRRALARARNARRVAPRGARRNVEPRRLGLTTRGLAGFRGRAGGLQPSCGQASRV